MDGVPHRRLADAGLDRHQRTGADHDRRMGSANRHHALRDPLPQHETHRRVLYTVDAPIPRPADPRAAPRDHLRTTILPHGPRPRHETHRRAPCMDGAPVPRSADRPATRFDQPRRGTHRQALYTAGAPVPRPADPHVAPRDHLRTMISPHGPQPQRGTHRRVPCTAGASTLPPASPHAARLHAA
jgi:hypothetical protein